MSKTEFRPEPEQMPAALFAAWNTAGLLLIELTKATGGNKSRIEDLKKQMIDIELDDIPGNLPMPDKAAFRTAYIQTVNSIFDRVSFTDDPNKATDLL